MPSSERLQPLAADPTGSRQSRKTVRYKRTTQHSFGVRRLAAAFPPASLLAGPSAPTSASKLAETKRRQAAALQSCAADFDATLANSKYVEA